MATVLNVYGRHRLLTFDRDPLTRGPTVEVAHEALLREWRRLRGWLEESRGDVRLQRLLAAAAGEWERSGREPSYLLQGARLAQFAGWAAGSKVALTAGEHEYLAESVAEREKREVEEKARREQELATALRLAETERERAEEQARAARRLRQRALWLAVALAVAAALAALAFLFGQSATQNMNAARTAQAVAVAEADVRATAQAIAVAEAAARATQQAVAEGEAQARATAEAVALINLNHSEALRLAGESNQLRLKEGNPELIALLALRSLALEYTPQGDEALEGAARLDYPTRVLTGTAGEALFSLAWSPDGRYIASGGYAGATYVWDAASGQQLHRLTGQTGFVPSTAFSPDGRYVASASADQTIRVWGVASGREVGQFPSTSGASAAFSPDGQYIATGISDTVQLWRVPTGEKGRAYAGATATVYWVAFSPDGRLVAAGGLDPRVWLWDAATGEPRGSFPVADRGTLQGLAFFPDGQTLLAAFQEGPVLLWDVSTALAGGAARWRFEHGNAVIQPYSFAISPDGRFLLVNSYTDGIGHLWDVATGQELHRFRDPTLVDGGAFSPDGRTVAIASMDGRVRLWALAPQDGLPRFPPRESFQDVAFAPDGRTIATAGMFDGTARLWDARSGAELRVFTHTATVAGVAFSPDGQTLITAAYDGQAHLWDIRTGQEIRRFAGHTAPNVNYAVFSPDGRSLATISAVDSTIRL